MSMNYRKRSQEIYLFFIIALQTPLVFVKKNEKSIYFYVNYK